MKLDALIARLTQMREELGPDALVFQRGWHAYGVIVLNEAKAGYVLRTKEVGDGEVVRKYEEADEGMKAVFLN